MSEARPLFCVRLLVCTAYRSLGSSREPFRLTMPTPAHIWCFASLYSPLETVLIVLTVPSVYLWGIHSVAHYTTIPLPHCCGHYTVSYAEEPLPSHLQYRIQRALFMPLCILLCDRLACLFDCANGGNNHGGLDFEWRCPVLNVTQQ